MTAQLPPMRLTGAHVLRDGHLQERSVALAAGRIAKGPLPAVDLRGFLVLPGVIDMMGRPGLVPQGPGGATWMLRDSARRAAARGVTLQYLRQGWSWETPQASPSAATTVAQTLGCIRQETTIDLRLMLQVEHDLAPDRDRVLDLVRQAGIDLVVFSNRAALARDLLDADPTGFAALARDLGQDAGNLRLVLDGLRVNGAAIPRALCALAEQFDVMGVRYGSLEDATGEAREHHSMIGAGLCIAPRSRKAAAAARAVSDPVVGSIADLIARLRTRTLAAEDLAGLDALVSDGAPMSMADFALYLDETGLMPLEKAWALISDYPARLLRLTDRGRLDHGCQADLTIVNARTRQVEATICGGRLAYLSGEAGVRFLDRDADRAIAAE